MSTTEKEDGLHHEDTKGCTDELCGKCGGIVDIHSYPVEMVELVHRKITSKMHYDLVVASQPPKIQALFADLNKLILKMIKETEATGAIH